MQTRPSSNVVVRPARAGDVEPALDLYADVAAERVHIGGEAPIDRPARRRNWLDSYARSDSYTLVCEVDGEIVGLGSLEGTGVAELGMLIAREWRGRGLGSSLLDGLIAWAQGSGAHKIALQVWPHNQAAIRLYEKFGFQREGYLRKHYRRKNGEVWDAVVMGLVLSDDGREASS
jgi:putative acetyltransferase